MNINTLKIIPLLGGNVSAYKLVLYITQYSLGMVQTDDGFNGEVYLNTIKLSKLLGGSRESIREGRNLLEDNNVIIKVKGTKDIFAINPEYSGIQTRDNDTTFDKKSHTKCVAIEMDRLSDKSIKRLNSKFPQSGFVWDESVDGPLPF